MATTTPHLSIEDFERLSDEQAHNHELVDGELVDVSGNTFYSNKIRDLLARRIGNFLETHDLGDVVAEQEFDFDGNAHGPDVSFFGPAKRGLLDGSKRVQRFVPDLAIEVVSPNDTFSKLLRKKDRYRRCGTAEVWLLAPESREVYTYSDAGARILRGDDELLTELLPGFKIKTSEIFSVLDRK